jgi:hypothetical protein
MNNTTIFTQMIEKAQIKNFNKKYDALVAYAEKNGFKKPKKGDLLTTVMKEFLDNITPEKYFQ